MKNTRPDLITLGITAVAASFVTLVIKNFVSGEKKIRKRIPRKYNIADPQFERSMSQLLGPPILDGNRIIALNNGVEIFPAMLAGIASAKTTITFETYIYWSGVVAEQFSNALSAKAREGVKVHVLIDGMGCDCVEGESLQRMKDAGVEVEVYHLHNLSRVNQRTHRKLLVIDGRMGFTGGVGIGDSWLGNADAEDHWRDTHYQVEGPVVAQFQAAFMDNWMKTHATVLHGDAYFPAIEEQGPHRCQMFKSSPMEGSESARLMYLLSITAAEKSLRVGNAYFVPDDLVTDTLIAAVRRGVTVEVLVPGQHLDSALVRRSSRHRWGRLLRNGVRVFEYQPTMYHCKVMIIDDLWVSVGSANFDNRSFRLNDEANLNVFDREFALRECGEFLKDKENAREVTWEEWKHRPLAEKAGDAAAALLRSQV
ncbi:MAG: phospholipase D-like domain-containing protein [Luteolibacter sp.]|uniref:phospholipase D-like domain-containing protein n=1 Tax=Luteolibacter sp. TaxID=1962973 RepID=UPI0032662C56